MDSIAPQVISALLLFFDENIGLSLPAVFGLGFSISVFYRIFTNIIKGENLEREVRRKEIINSREQDRKTEKECLERKMQLMQSITVDNMRAVCNAASHNTNEYNSCQYVSNGGSGIVGADCTGSGGSGCAITRNSENISLNKTSTSTTTNHQDVLDVTNPPSLNNNTTSKQINIGKSVKYTRFYGSQNMVPVDPLPGDIYYDDGENQTYMYTDTDRKKISAMDIKLDLQDPETERQRIYSADLNDNSKKDERHGLLSEGANVAATVMRSFPMANTCSYKVIVYGARNACYAFYGSMPTKGYREVIKDNGSEENCELFFVGECKWSVDAYCHPVYPGIIPVELPESAEKAFEVSKQYTYHSVKNRSEMFEVEVLCCYMDIEGGDEDNMWEHYKNGVAIDDNMPDELLIRDNAKVRNNNRVESTATQTFKEFKDSLYRRSSNEYNTTDRAHR